MKKRIFSPINAANIIYLFIYLSVYSIDIEYPDHSLCSTAYLHFHSGFNFINVKLLLH